ncbi:MAG: response regulator [Alphaproteobacteria bacterium]|nr:response regulator [Alphaproteobacteria bacterium]MCD8570501.1 response regulator [Alphaproteobacteria bacterium]
MKIILQEAEEYLVQVLKARYSLPRAGYCLQIAGHVFHPKEFESLLHLIQSWVGSETGEIIICRDRDIFVFSPHFSEEFFAKFRLHFMAHYEHSAIGQTKILSFYDIDIQGMGLIELAESKHEKCLVERYEEIKRVQAEARDERKKRFLNMSLNEDLVSTVVQRRHARTQLEILVVEDEQFSRKLVAAALSAYTVSFAEDGYSAVLAYVQKAPDIVFLDINLPDVMGNDVLTKILSIDMGAYIVMLSANSQTENVIGTVRAGAKGFVGKPFTKDKLLQYIARCPRAQSERVGV